jgi:tRNA 2-selenouridine synthase
MFHDFMYLRAVRAACLRARCAFKESKRCAHITTMTRADSDSYAEILISGLPLLDVRAPIEFAMGSFPGAINVPLMEDDERHRVGIRYKQAGHASALKLGHELVNGQIKSERVARWVEFARAHPDGYLYCFRGGSRSLISQQWLAEAGIRYPRVVGGYKAMRGFLIDQAAQAFARSEFILVAGFTGSGKTEVIQSLTAAIDLEKLAHHRGSSFGQHASQQTKQIDFDNSLAISLMRLHARQIKRIALEDESRHIGKCFLPDALQKAMLVSPVVWVEEPLSSRVDRILHDYVQDLGAQFHRKHGAEDGFVAFSNRLLESLQSLQKKLGGERHASLSARMKDALRIQFDTGCVDAHREWIQPLLTQYYDPMYEQNRADKASRIIFSGSLAEVTRYLIESGH